MNIHKYVYSYIHICKLHGGLVLISGTCRRLLSNLFNVNALPVPMLRQVYVEAPGGHLGVSSGLNNGVFARDVLQKWALDDVNSMLSWSLLFKRPS